MVSALVFMELLVCCQGNDFLNCKSEIASELLVKSIELPNLGNSDF